MRIVEVIVGKTYKHFKGEYYRVLCIANDSMTPPGEPLREVVIYESLYGSHKFWSRPYELFIEKVDKSYSLSDGFLGMGADQLYEGAIYIPIRQDIIAASLGGKNYYNLPGTKDAIQIASKWADEAAVRNYRPAPSLASQLGK